MQVGNRNSSGAKRPEVFATDDRWLDIGAFEAPGTWRDSDCRPRLEECPECGGTGLDPGGLSTTDRTDCQMCAGSGWVLRDYLSEALRIVRGRERAAVQREHLLAIIYYFGEVIRAMSSVSEGSSDATW